MSKPTDVDIDSLLEESFHSFNSKKDNLTNNALNNDKKRSIEQISDSNSNSNSSISNGGHGESDMKKIRSKSPEKSSSSQNRDRDYRDSRDRERDRYYRDSRDRDYYKDSRDKDYNRDRDYRDSRDSRDSYYRDNRDRDSYYRDSRDRERDSYYKDNRDRNESKDLKENENNNNNSNNNSLPSSKSQSESSSTSTSTRDSLERNNNNNNNITNSDSLKEPDEESDQRTVFISNLSPFITKSDLYNFFQQAGKVLNVSLIIDKVTNKLKGVGYVEFETILQVEKAVSLAGKKVLDQPIQVYTIQPEKKSNKSTTGNCRIYVGYINIMATEDQIRNIFLSFGDIDFINIHTKSGISKYAFVQFRTTESAKKALSEVNGMEFMGKNLKVNLVSEEKNLNGTYIQLPTQITTNVYHHPAKPKALNGKMMPQHLYQQQMNSNISLDDDETGGIPLTAQRRAQFSAKFMGATNPTTNPSLPKQPLISSPPIIANNNNNNINNNIVVPPSNNTFKSTCLLLKNMFDPDTETDPDWDKDVLRDTHEECSIFGPIKHIHLDKHSKGFIYIRYENTEAPMLAINKLHGRWFSQKLITAELVPEPIYKLQFPF